VNFYRALHVIGMSNYMTLYEVRGSGNSVGITTDYGLDGPGSGSRWGRDFPPVQTDS